MKEKIELTAHSEAEGSAATMPKAAIKARATGEKDFMIGDWGKEVRILEVGA